MTCNPMYETISVLSFTKRTRSGNIAVTVNNTNFIFQHSNPTKTFPAGGSKPVRFISSRNSIGGVI